ncbi:MAG TPA: hypothetical protein GX745_00020 [Clostridiales bacterium]|jgi:hypothetical protein|nr:hypothetical protein [Clostridiales bacterium]
MKKRALALTALIITTFIIIGGCSGPPMSKKKIIEHINNDTLPVESVLVAYAYNINDLTIKVGEADYVFVGEVKDYIKTKYNYVDETPRTFYSVRVIENIKGELIQDQDIEVRKTGGIDKKGKKILVYQSDYLPKFDRYYIFSVYANPKGFITAVGPNSSILLQDKENYQDSEEYKKIIKAYQNQKEIDKKRYQSKYDKNYKK